MNKIGIAIHGGAGTIARHLLTPETALRYSNALLEAATIGHQILKKGGSSLDAVENSIRSLEDCPLFNAGKGAVFNAVGHHEMDASIMIGNTKLAGAVGNISSVRNPISFARKVMETTEHVYLSGAGAMEYARLNNIPMEEENYFYDEYRFQQWQQAKSAGKIQMDHSALDEKKFGTVGAVALDLMGNIAAGTSTGGMTNKRFGRVGDSPIIGAGTYANNETCGISCTGHGEYFIRAVVAYDVHCLMAYKNLTLHQACEEVVKNKLVKDGGEGGLIGIDQSGVPVLCFNTEGMYRAWVDEKGAVHTAIN
jgi:beta-aspartyl-peptidase (threonine type)